MIEKLLKNSGFDIDKYEHNIIEAEISDMIDELKVLSDYRPKIYETFNNSVKFSKLREDEVKPSNNIAEILANSKSKNSIGFLVSKII